MLRTCYHAMKHQSGDIIRPKDCILLRSGSKKTDLPYVAKVAHLWEDPEDGKLAAVRLLARNARRPTYALTSRRRLN